MCVRDTREAGRTEGYSDKVTEIRNDDELHNSNCRPENRASCIVCTCVMLFTLCVFIELLEDLRKGIKQQPTLLRLRLRLLSAYSLKIWHLFFISFRLPFLSLFLLSQSVVDSHLRLLLLLLLFARRDARTAECIIC